MTIEKIKEFLSFVFNPFASFVYGFAFGGMYISLKNLYSYGLTTQEIISKIWESFI